MTSKTITWVLGAVAVALAVVLAVVLVQRPQPEAGTSAGPVSSTPPAEPSTGRTTPAPADADPSAEGGPSDLPSSEVADDGDASPGTIPYSQTEEAGRQWRPVATGFGKAFTMTRGKTVRQWRAALAPYVTGDVRDQLSTVDLTNVPDGTFAGIEPAEYGDDKVAVFVHYDTGLTLVTYLILDGTSWRIYAYDRWED